MSGVLHGKSGSKALKTAIRGLLKTQVLVGFPAGGEQAEGSHLTLAQLAYIQDRGAPEANIPAREFMAPGIRAVQDQIAVQLRRAAQAAIMGDAAGVEAAQTGAGIVAVGSIKNLITEGISPALAPKTLAARKRVGFEGKTPLLRTGQLRNGVQFVLARKGR